jgi:hypothetical protein
MTLDTTTIILIAAILAGLALILLGLRVGRRQRLERSADEPAGP